MNGSKKILFVDDDADFLDAQRAFFESRGFDVLTAETSEECLELLATHAPDLAVLDLMMEHYDSGITLARRIRANERCRDMPLVMISGVAAATGCRLSEEAAQLRDWSKIEVFLDKPVTGRQLLAVAERLIESRTTPPRAP